MRHYIRLGLVMVSVAGVLLIGLPAISASGTTTPNLFVGDQGNFDTGTGTWMSFTASGTLSEVSAPTQSGTGAMAVTNDEPPGSGGLDVWIGSGSDPSSWTSATPGVRYTGTAFVQTASTSRTVASAEVFYDAAGNQLSAVWGGAVNDSPGKWIALPPNVGIAPPGTSYIAYGFIFYATAPGEIHYVDTASLTGTTAQTTSLTGPFHTTGNQILQASGTPVIYRGFNRAGTETSPSQFPTDVEIAQANAWGANFMRVPLNESLWLNTCTRTKPSNDRTYPGKVDAEVSSITSRGMLALLDLHFNVSATCRTAGPQAMADDAYAPTFWSQVAARYKGNPLVAFDLYNEPHAISDTVWLSGGTATYGTVSFKAAGMQKLYDTVRKQGAENLVFISGLDWGDRPATQLVSGKDIVNAIHAYTCSEQPPPNCLTPNPFDPSPTLSKWLTVSKTNAVMVTEFGWPDRFDGTYNQNVINYASTQGWGWSVFSWGGTASTSPWDLIGSTGSVFEPAPSGMPVLAGLADN